MLNKERSLLMSIMHEQLEASRSGASNAAAPLTASQGHQRVQQVQRQSQTRDVAKELHRKAAMLSHEELELPHAVTDSHVSVPVSDSSAVQQGAGAQHAESSGQLITVSKASDTPIGANTLAASNRQHSKAAQHSHATARVAQEAADCQSRALEEPSNTWHSNPFGAQKAVQNGITYNEQESFRQDKEKLVPNLSACIQEVKLLRASLSNTASLAQE